MNESAVNQWLEDTGLIAKAEQPGVYAIRLKKNGTQKSLRERWQEYYKFTPPRSFFTRIELADDLLYVGAAHQSIKQRLNDHANGYKSPTFLEIFPPIEPYALLACDNPGEMEWNYANWLARDRTRVWSDGTFY